LPNTTKEEKDKEDRGEEVQHRDRGEKVEKFRLFVMGFLVFSIQEDYAVFGGASDPTNRVNLMASYKVNEYILVTPGGIRILCCWINQRHLSMTYFLVRIPFIKF
jgi:hypothetical protein